MQWRAAWMTAGVSQFRDGRGNFRKIFWKLFSMGGTSNGTIGGWLVVFDLFTPKARHNAPFAPLRPRSGNKTRF